MAKQCAAAIANRLALVLSTTLAVVPAVMALVLVDMSIIEKNRDVHNGDQYCDNRVVLHFSRRHLNFQKPAFMGTSTQNIAKERTE